MIREKRRLCFGENEEEDDDVREKEKIYANESESIENHWSMLHVYWYPVCDLDDYESTVMVI